MTLGAGLQHRLGAGTGQVTSWFLEALFLEKKALTELTAKRRETGMRQGDKPGC